MYVCYLKGKRNDIFIIKMLSSIFKCEKEAIGSLLDDREVEIKFENRLLDETSEFCTELCVYSKDENIIFSNDFLFGIQASKYLDEEVIVSIKGDDPYIYILIKDDLFFQVDEDIIEENYGISIQESSKMEISYNDAIRISN